MSYLIFVNMEDARLVLMHNDGEIGDDEFLVLYEANHCRNLHVELSYWQYDRFGLAAIRGRRVGVSVRQNFVLKCLTFIDSLLLYIFPLYLLDFEMSSASCNLHKLLR